MFQCTIQQNLNFLLSVATFITKINQTIFFHSSTMPRKTKPLSKTALDDNNSKILDVDNDNLVEIILVSPSKASVHHEEVDHDQVQTEDAFVLVNPASDQNTGKTLVQLVKYEAKQRQETRK